MWCVSANPLAILCTLAHNVSMSPPPLLLLLSTPYFLPIYKLVSRYSGAEFRMGQCDLTAEQRRMYDTSALLWQKVAARLKFAFKRSKTEGRTASLAWNQYWSGHQRFFRSMCMSMKVPWVVKEARRALSEGQSVVIGLQCKLTS